MKYIIGNWKMYPRSMVEAKELTAQIRAISNSAVKKGIQPIICPPTAFLGGLVKSGALQFGGQNSSPFADGAYTGEVSPVQLYSLGVKYVILGHSERRALGESNNEVVTKAVAAAKAGLNIVLCVGEKERDNEGRYFMEVAAQLHASLHGFPENKIAQLIVAYEPVWAIGTDAASPATPRDHQEMSMLLRRTLSEIFGKEKGFRIPLIYGGSVDKKNAQSFLDVGADGLLIGRTSLKAKDFISIIHNASETHA